MTTPFVAKRGHLIYGTGRLNHNLVRDTFCDVCHLPLVGSPVQKRHLGECARIGRAKLARKGAKRRRVGNGTRSVNA